MTTTTLRLPEPLKRRIAEVADQTGQTAHAFMLEALQEKTDEAEWRVALYAEAKTRADQFDVDGKSIEWHEMKTWLLARAQGKPVKPPRAKVQRRAGK